MFLHTDCDFANISLFFLYHFKYLLKFTWIPVVRMFKYLVSFVTYFCCLHSPYSELGNTLMSVLTKWHDWASLVAQTVKNPPAMRESWVRSRGREGPLEKGMATHSSALAWRVPGTEEPGGCSPWAHREWDTPERLSAAQQKGHNGSQDSPNRVELFRADVFDRLACVRARPVNICPWNSPGGNAGVGSHSPLRRIFPTRI